MKQRQRKWLMAAWWKRYQGETEDERYGMGLVGRSTTRDEPRKSKIRMDNVVRKNVASLAAEQQVYGIE